MTSIPETLKYMRANAERILNATSGQFVAKPIATGRNLAQDIVLLCAALEMAIEQRDEVHAQFWDDVVPNWVFEQDNQQLQSILKGENYERQQVDAIGEKVGE